MLLLIKKKKQNKSDSYQNWQVLNQYPYSDNLMRSHKQEFSLNKQLKEFTKKKVMH